MTQIAIIVAQPALHGHPARERRRTKTGNHRPDFGIRPGCYRADVVKDQVRLRRLGRIKPENVPHLRPGRVTGQHTASEIVFARVQLCPNATVIPAT